MKAKPHQAPECCCKACEEWRAECIGRLIGATIHLAWGQTLTPTKEQLETWESWVIEDAVRRIEEQSHGNQ